MPNAPTFHQISSDAFKSWSRCKKQFYYKYVRRLQWPSDIRHFRLGRDVHKLLDYQARGLDCDVLLTNAPDDVRFSWQKLLPHPIVNLPVVANEWAFHVPIQLPNKNTEWLTGRLDRVARDGDRILIIDWKTGTGIPIRTILQRRKRKRHTRARILRKLKSWKNHPGAICSRSEFPAGSCRVLLRSS